jgi:hypothetical protein
VPCSPLRHSRCVLWNIAIVVAPACCFTELRWMSWQHMQHQSSSLLQIARCSDMQSVILHCRTTVALGLRLVNPVHCDAVIPRQSFAASGTLASAGGPSFRQYKSSVDMQIIVRHF